METQISMWFWKNFSKRIPVTRCQGARGFTLVELVVGTFIFSIVVAIAAAFFVTFFRNYDFSFDQGRTVSETNRAFRDITEELREVRTSEDGAYALVTADDQEIGFYADIDNDGRVERVRYFLDGEVFNKGVIEPDVPPTVYDEADEQVQVISEFVKNGVDPVFYYYNGDWPGDEVNNPLDPTGRLLETRVVRVEMKINTAEGQQEDFELGTQVMLRNLKDNY